MYSKPIILVVEGAPSDGETLPSIFDSSQYHTVFVESPEDALAHINSPIDLVLSRIGPDEPRGREVLQFWKARCPETPFVLLVDAAGVPSARRAVEQGATGYVTLPTNGSDLSNQLSRWLALAQQAGHPHTNGRPANDVHRDAGAIRSDGNLSIHIPPGTTLEDLERAAVEQALDLHNGNRTHAAKELGISVRTLQRKLKAWGEANGHSTQPAGQQRESAVKPDSGGRSWNTNPAAPKQTTYRPRLATV